MKDYLGHDLSPALANMSTADLLAYASSSPANFSTIQASFPSLHGLPPSFAPPAAPGTASGAGTGTTPGATPRDYRSDTGGVPQVPSLAGVQQEALAADASALPSILGLAGNINLSNQQNLIQQLRAGLPGYDALTAASSGNIQNLLHGVIPQDVKNLITQNAAERGIATGLYDSPNADASLLQALGLTSLGLQQQGEGELTSAIQRTPTVSPMDISKMLIDPTQAYEAKLLANIYAAAPSPGAARDSLLNTLNRGYGQGRSNVPGTRGTGDAVTPYRSSGAGNFAYTPAQSPEANQWTFDPQIGGYYNNLTGQISDAPGGQPWEGFNYGDIYNMRAGSAPGFNWDESLGMFYNPTTGEISDNPEAGYSTGLASDLYPDFAA